MKKIIFYLVAFSLAYCVQAKAVYIDELDTKYMLQDWGVPQVNKNIVGGSLSINGKTYTRGIGTHSISRFMLNLGGKATSISGLAGADDQNDYTCKMEFKILGDGKEIWASGIMHKGMPAKKFKVNLKGINKIVLLVCEGGDGIMYDHADWIETKIETNGEVIPELVVPDRIKTEKYILTPLASDTPRIHSPKVFGVRPHSPFLYKVAATGLEPITYTAYQLPAGLSIDKETGIISGTLTKAGIYYVVVRADNKLGGDSRIVTVKVGDEICLTPTMGWNSWNCWGTKVDEEKVMAAADYMNRELSKYGWTYINIDDGWEAKNRTENGELLGNEKFPDFKKISTYLHSKGLKFGIYSSPGPRTCGGYLGSYQHESIDARTWAKWGVDLLKYDYCFYTDVVSKPTEALIKEPYVVMNEALKNVNRDIVYCVGYGAPNVWNWGREAGGHFWRTTRDITDEWNVVTAIGCFQDVCASVTKPGNYNDPDMLVVGKLGMGWGAKAHDSYLTPDEQYSHVSLWCLLSSPLLIGCDMSEMDEFTHGLLTNGEVLAVNQDPEVKPAHKILTQDGQIWYKELEDGAVAVGLFNIDPYEILWDKSQSESVQTKKYDMTISLSDLNLKGKYKVRDLWCQKDITTIDKAYTATVPYHGVVLIKLTPEK